MSTVDEIFDDLRGKRFNDGNSCNKDVVDVITGLKLKWRINTWKSKVTSVNVSDIKFEGHQASKVEVNYDWSKRIEYFLAPGVKDRADSMDEGTGQFEFVCGIALGRLLIINETLKHIGGDGYSGKKIYSFIKSKDGK